MNCPVCGTEMKFKNDDSRAEWYEETHYCPECKKEYTLRKEFDQNGLVTSHEWETDGNIIEKDDTGNYCPKCGEHFFVHNDDGSCVNDGSLQGEECWRNLKDIQERIRNNEAIVIIWDIDDVISEEDSIDPEPNPLLSRYEIRDVLEFVREKHDRVIGITYDTICQAITEILNRREE